MYFISGNKKYNSSLFGNNKMIMTERDIASFFDFSLVDYRNWLIENYNGFAYKKITGVFFKNKVDVERALEHLESINLMKVLKGDIINV